MRGLGNRVPISPLQILLRTDITALYPSTTSSPVAPTSASDHRTTATLLPSAPRLHACSISPTYRHLSRFPTSSSHSHRGQHRLDSIGLFIAVVQYSATPYQTASSTRRDFTTRPPAPAPRSPNTRKLPKPTVTAASRQLDMRPEL